MPPKGISNNKLTIKLTRDDFDTIYRYMDKHNITLAQLCREAEVSYPYFQGVVSRINLQGSTLAKKPYWNRLKKVVRSS